jgi:hypothetical protein
MRSAMLPPVALSFLYRLARRALQLLRLHRLDAFSTRRAPRPKVLLGTLDEVPGTHTVWREQWSRRSRSSTRFHKSELTSTDTSFAAQRQCLRRRFGKPFDHVHNAPTSIEWAQVQHNAGPISLTSAAKGEGRQNYDDIGECPRTTALQVDGAACQ